MNDTKQPEPLQLAEWLDFWSQPTAKKAASELRRLHALTLEWQQKAETWLASPAAAQRLKGYQELTRRLNAAEQRRDELLVALTKLVEDLELRSNWKCGKEKGIVDCGDSVYRNARAAIAKAEGENQ